MYKTLYNYFKCLQIIFVLGIYCSYAICQNKMKDSKNLDRFTLNALKIHPSNVFSNKTRDLNTIVNDSSSFNCIFPDTDISCGYVLRYFFHTNIKLGKDSNVLISMDGRMFSINNTHNEINHKQYIQNLTKIVINKISRMHFGSSEIKDFIDAYPEVDLNN